MALDKQRILSELGNVVNQLQNADCGCMGNMFSKPDHGGNCLGNPLPTCGGCRRGTCPGHGYNVNHMTGSGDPFGMGGGMDTSAGGGGGMERGMGMHGGGMGMQGGGMGMRGGGMGIHGGGMGMRGGGMGMHGGGMGMQRGGMGMHGGGMGMHGGGMGMREGGMDMQRGGMEMQGDMGMQGGMEMQDGGGMGMSEGGMKMSEGGMGMGGGKMRMGGGGMGMGGGGMGMGGGRMGMGGGGMGMYGRNAPKLYADTYNYLNKNLMQPVMQEVYNDLKTITPENAIGNNPLAAKMGLPMNQGGGMTGAPGMGGSMQPAGVGGGNPMQGMGGASAGTPGDMGHMGAQMVNMMMSSGRGKTPNIQPGNLGPQMGAAEPQPANMGITNMNPGGGGINSNQPESGMPNMGHGMMQNPVTQYATSDNTYMNSQDGRIPQGNIMTQGNVVGGSMRPDSIVNPAIQQTQNGIPTMQQNMGNINSTNHVMTNPYGQHAAGIKKFNEMFPGVNQGGLDFDPMAIAMQMNPANQKQAALDQITKLMTGNRGMMQPSLAGTNAAAAALGQANAIPQNQIVNQQIASQPGQSPGSQTVNYPGTNQQVYAAQGNPGMVQQLPQQQIQGQLQTDPSTGAPIMPTEEIVDPNAQTQGYSQEPQNPANAYNAQPQEVYYNTLGQPIQMLPKTTYHSPMPSLPQTLNGSYVQPGYGVKNTMSKTSLATNNMPIGKSASKSQLQHIYRQYKATHSQPNFRPAAPIYSGSHSLAQLNTAPVPVNPTSSASATANQNAAMHQQMQQAPVEKVGGDTIANNQQPKMEQPMAGKVGDGPPSNLQAGDTAVYEKMPAMQVRRERNGLQDMKFANYHSSAAWSFHG